MTRINEMIRADAIRVIDKDGKQLGIMSVREGVRAAREAGLDLVEVAPQSDPPVCRLMDFGKYKYEQNKRAREGKKHQHIIIVKEIKFRPKTDEHDYEFKLKHIKKFLAEKHKVKVSIRFRGREMAHMGKGAEILAKVINDVADIGEEEQRPKVEGNSMVMVLKPKH